MALASTTTPTIMARGGSVAGTKSTATPNPKQKVHTRWRTPAMKKTPFSLFRVRAGLNPTTDQMTADAAASSCSRHRPRSSKNSASRSQVHTPETKDRCSQFSVFRSVQMNNLLTAKQCNCTTTAATTNDESRRENNPS